MIDIANLTREGQIFTIAENWENKTYTITRRIWVAKWKRFWYYLSGRCPYHEITYTGVKLENMWTDIDGTFHACLHVPPSGDGVDIQFVL